MEGQAETEKNTKKDLKMKKGDRNGEKRERKILTRKHIAHFREKGWIGWSGSGTGW